MTEADADRRFTEILAERGLALCPDCGKQIDRGDVSWNTGGTGSGTEYTIVNIVCERCGEEVARVTSWFGGDSFEEIVDQVLASEASGWNGD